MNATVAQFPDYMFTLLISVGIVVLGISYVFRMLTRGAARFDRTAKIGGSVLVAQGVLDWWYWMMEPVAKAMAAVGLSANAVTWLSLFFGAGAGAAIAVGRFGLAMWLGVMSALLDILDGFVARLTHTSSDSGEVLDAAIDRYTEMFFLAGLCIWYRENLALLVLTMAAALGTFMISYSTAKAEAMGVVPPRGAMRRHERATYLFTASGISAFTVAWFEPQRFSKPIGVPMVLALLIVAVVSNVSAVRRFGVIIRAIRARELAAKATAVVRTDVEETAGDGADHGHTAAVAGAGVESGAE
jgi:CDP-diacylglycerol--glycerol-3-phosphate 3-phosphatidyltransferase